MSPQACSQCGAALYPAQRFCARCGHAASGPLLPVAAPPPTPLPATPPYVAALAGGEAVLPPGTLLDGGRYRIIGLLNAGSFGAVYEAVDQRLDDVPRAVKELRVTLARTAAEQREVEQWFDREARLLMNLRHDMTPRFWDRFSQQGHQYLVMDLVPGRNLAQELRARGGPLPEVEALEWGLALCGVLAYLHQRRPPLVFRDLKPANIMRTPDGMLYLIDFGIARGLAAIGPGGTQGPGTLIGTPGYSPPEMYQGLFEPASDIYALGATLYHLLTGYDPEQQRPFTFPPARRLRPDLQPETEEVLRRALEMRPGERFADMRAMALALAAARDRAALAVGAHPGLDPAAGQAGPFAPASSTPTLGSHTPVPFAPPLGSHTPAPGSVTPTLSSSMSPSSTPTLASFTPPSLSPATPSPASATPTLSSAMPTPAASTPAMTAATPVRLGPARGVGAGLLVSDGARRVGALLGGAGAVVLYILAAGWPPAAWPLFVGGVAEVGVWCLSVLLAERLWVYYKYGSGAGAGAPLWPALLGWALAAGVWCLIALSVALQGRGGLDLTWNLLFIMIILAAWCGEPLRLYQRARTLRELSVGAVSQGQPASSGP